MAENVAACAPVKGPRVSEGHRETVLSFMEQHPQLASRSSELGPGFTAGDRRRLWQQLADVLNEQGPMVKAADQWQEWWRKQVYEARRDAIAIAQVQRSTGGGRAPGFHGRVLNLTGMVRLRGVADLPYQEQADVPTAAMEVVVEAADVRSTATPAEDPPRGASDSERVAAAPVLQRPVRPPRRQRPRRVDTLTTMSSQCARSLEQDDEMLQVGRSFGVILHERQIFFVLGYHK
ncbi:uncharacterized protein LOC125945784 [Dermacentor silvarum]|uniref:uncharacterized protein LOC125945784 n=1 Tax=Dermacentor silvarum TaxID=543639 RepID=UPI0021008A90|nr:uncharacterized protein LOC125945784 [Dermacentor silvarum]